MDTIAEKSAIKVEILGGVKAMEVTTSFSGLDLKRGIVRLLSLVKEKNYMIRCDEKGSRMRRCEIEFLAILGISYTS